MKRKTPIRPPGEFWHIRHSCGHGVFWSDPQVAVQVSAYACPWCGAEGGKRVPPDLPLTWDTNTGIVAFRSLLPDGTVPWPIGNAGDYAGPITIRHMQDESCCGPLIEAAELLH